MKMQKKIIKELKTKSIIYPFEEIENCIKFIQNFLLNNKNINALIVGISGGKDSTLVGKLCKKAIKRTKNKNFKLIALRLPYGKQLDEEYCKMALNFINPDIIININIKNSVINSKKSLENAGIKISNYLLGNEKSRERMKVQYTIAGKYNGIVVGTSNASELATGFFTKYGDGGCDISPISHLNTRQVKNLLKYMNCPKKLYSKIPTADLEDDKPGLPDETALGIKYKNIDDFLEGKIIDKKIANKIEYLFIKTKHKRKLPIKCIEN
ncbi:NH(3)-dependent NAD(+) synthetase [Buchnera aphidicola (Neophyllaphis podocarpi)]|uniref:ammonia-dependent NAD(+) synthetase n=1 Tax=Buchnera aphidicola TaxID=9 RepID=UPI003463F4CE